MFASSAVVTASLAPSASATTLLSGSVLSGTVLSGPLLSGPLLSGPLLSGNLSSGIVLSDTVLSDTALLVGVLPVGVVPLLTVTWAPRSPDDVVLEDWALDDRAEALPSGAAVAVAVAVAVPGFVPVGFAVWLAATVDGVSGCTTLTVSSGTDGDCTVAASPAPTSTISPADSSTAGVTVDGKGD